VALRDASQSVHLGGGGGERLVRGGVLRDVGDELCGGGVVEGGRSQTRAVRREEGGDTF
jgi:hypothetical protein